MLQRWIGAATGWMTNWRAIMFVSVWLGCMLYAPILYRYYTSTDGIFDSVGYPVGRDYVNVWTAARLTLDGDVNDLFDVSKFHPKQEALVGRPFQFHNWSYPPHFIPMILGIGLLPYLWGFGIWMAVTFAGYAVSIVAGRDKKLVPMLVALIAPSSYANLLAGQNGFLTASLLIGGMRLLDRYPIWSGVLFGMLTIKPQLGVLVPVALIAAGAWRAVASAIATAGLMIGGSVALFGLEPWSSYFRLALPLQRDILEHWHGTFASMMPTAFMAARLMNWSIETGYVLNALTAVIAAVATAWCYRNRSIDSNLRIAIFAIGTFLASPYAFNYDLTIVTAALIGVVAFQRPERPRPLELLIIVAMWELPVSVLSVLSGDDSTHLPYGPVILGATLIALLARANAFSFRLPNRGHATENTKLTPL